MHTNLQIRTYHVQSRKAFPHLETGNAHSLLFDLLQIFKIALNTRQSLTHSDIHFPPNDVGQHGSSSNGDTRSKYHCSVAEVGCTATQNLINAN